MDENVLDIIKAILQAYKEEAVGRSQDYDRLRRELEELRRENNEIHVKLINAMMGEKIICQQQNE